MNMARSMLKEKHIPNEYSGNAVVCSIYILNISPTKSVKNQVPGEAWSGKNNNISHLRIFGCVVYAHVREQMRRKLDDRDVEFKEEEDWDGRIDKIVLGGAEIPHEDDDGDEQDIQGGQLTPRSHTPATRTLVRKSPGVIPSQLRTPKIYEFGEPSGHGGQQTKSEVSDESNSTLASLRNKIRGHKTRSLKELYEKNDEVDQVSNFALIAYMIL
jgi:hypothetical protein